MGLIYLLPIDEIRFLFHRKNYNPLLLLYPMLHLTSTPTKSNLYFANSLTAVVSEPYPYSLLTFHVPNVMSLFRWLCRTKVSVQIRGSCKHFVMEYFFFTVRSYQHLAQPPSWCTAPCRLYVRAYSIYSQLPSILEVVPPSAT